MFCARGAVEVVELRSLSTGSRSTTRLGRPARVELSSTTGGFKRSRQHRGAGHTTRARVDGFTRVKKPFGKCSGRVLHRSYLRGHRAKGSAVAAAASKAAARRVCASGGIGGGFTITLAGDIPVGPRTPLFRPTRTPWTPLFRPLRARKKFGFSAPKHAKSLKNRALRARHNSNHDRSTSRISGFRR